MTSQSPESPAHSYPQALWDAADLHRALGHSTRLRLVQTLVDGEASVGDLSRSLGLAQATTSRHLALLHSLRLVRRRRTGHHVLYRLTTEEVGALVTFAVRVASGLNREDGRGHGE